MSKSILVSKVFWFNLLTGVAQYAGLIPVDPAYTAAAVAIANVLLRFLSTKPVTLTLPT